MKTKTQNIYTYLFDVIFAVNRIHLKYKNRYIEFLSTVRVGYNNLRDRKLRDGRPLIG